MATKQAAHKRTFREIRKSLLLNLTQGQKNVNQLADAAHVNWHTTRRQMIYLIGFGYARYVVNYPQVKIFEITEKGMDALDHKKV
ncbi:hypothetical protein HOD83_00065 [Candidatus Woesearchaeota archaeon]|jgi:predicted transcriptional regulator|nr:hypothetical protein [Candidatus Woesearchaeota archaeon]MBT4247974.1 hypothetical protein [Candidatus Woesearchaeota archaeon]